MIAFDLYVLFILRVKCIVEYVRNDIYDNIVISFYTLNGEFKYKYEIPLVNFGRSGVKFKLVREQGKNEEVTAAKESRLKVTEIFDKYMEFRNYYQTNNDMICDIRDYIKKKILLADFDLKICEGMENASNTGIVCGLLWSASGLLIAFLSNIFTIGKKRVAILPNYKKSEFSVDFHCIFHMKLVHIIVMIIKIRRNVKKKKLIEKTGGVVNDRASHRGAYDDSNGKYQGNG